jgi:hypothetical protein
MHLKIETFDNAKGGNSVYKAIAHPLAARAVPALLDRLAGAGPVAVYDPLGIAEGFGEFYDLSALDIAGVFVQDLSQIGKRLLGRAAQPVTDLPVCKAATVLVAAFDAPRLLDHMRHLLPAGAAVATLDEIRLPEALLSNRRAYLDPLNFATNFVFFTDRADQHTRLATANYWSGYGAGEVSLYLVLFDAAGDVLAEWQEAVAPNAAAIVLDSREIRARFGLPEFTGQLFLHVVGARGHDVVKYALDTFGPDGTDANLSCTHDANSWPAELYAGLPAPADGEQVLLWIQNSHPCPIPPRSVGMGLMGRDEVAWLEAPLAPFASHPVDVAALLPKARWPEQIEIRAGKYVVRPRYEVVRNGRRRIAHPNVERTDLKPDPRLPELGNLLGKGYLLPAPILPASDWRSIVLPTPMATDQKTLPIAALVYDESGREVAAHRFGTLARRESVALEAAELLGGSALPKGWGHMELVYDFAGGGEADGWLHGLFRYEHRASGHAAETSFGAHVFNTVLTYKGEPQSYAGRPPGLSTRLFLRLGPAGYDTFCHLIYAASTPWHATSATDLVLTDAAGAEVARERIAIACSGSLFWRAGEVFGAGAIARAGNGGYVVVRDTTCRLFGYHGLLGRDGAFSLDHMFGF